MGADYQEHLVKGGRRRTRRYIPLVEAVVRLVVEAEEEEQEEKQEVEGLG